jgi:hypothetical protein
MPAVSGQQLDYTQVNVQTRIGSGGTSTLLGQVPNAGACGSGNGWYFDAPVVMGGPAPTTITLCPSSCDPLKMTNGSQLQVLLGCKTVSAIR